MGMWQGNGVMWPSLWERREVRSPWEPGREPKLCTINVFHLLLWHLTNGLLSFKPGPETEMEQGRWIASCLFLAHSSCQKEVYSFCFIRLLSPQYISLCPCHGVAHVTIICPLDLTLAYYSSVLLPVLDSTIVRIKPSTPSHRNTNAFI